AALERSREPFVEPRRHAVRGNLAHERVCELVSEDPVEFFGIVQRAAHGNADRSVIRAGGPRRRSRDVAELLVRIEDDGNRCIRISPERAADAPEGALERIERLVRERGLVRPFERDGEMRADPLLQAVVQRGFAVPAVQRGRRLLVIGDFGDERFVESDGARQIAARYSTWPSSARARLSFGSSVSAYSSAARASVSRRSSSAAAPAPR